MIRLRIMIVSLMLALLASYPARAQNPDPKPDGPPFTFPLAGAPGPNTWLYQQHYGNTTQAFNYGDVWYAAGQGMHFGLDLQAPCGTPVRAIADGVVTYVDAAGFGALPHSLVIVHPGTGYSSLYGHLRDVPRFVRGDTIARGQQIGFTGDPDGSCESRPHLHLEIRNEIYGIAYNPLPFFEMNWHMIASIGSYNHNFQQDLDNPRRWMTMEDQPEITFSGNLLNFYQRPWPPKLEIRPPVNPPTARDLGPLPETVIVTLDAVRASGWNVGAWWDPRDLNAVYVVDQSRLDGTPAQVYRQPLDGGLRTAMQPAPPPFVSPDGAYEVTRVDGWLMRLTRRADGATWTVDTEGNYPAISPDGARLLYEIVYGESVPGTSNPGVGIFVSNLDGSNLRRVHTLNSGYSMWLDDHRLLIVRLIPFTAETQLYILDLDAPDQEAELLGSYRYLQGLQVAPGGGRIAYYTPFQENTRDSAVYAQRARPGSEPVKMDFFGPYRWRDDDTLYTLSFDAASDAHALGVADANTGDHRLLTDPDELPIRVANGEWSVSPDGHRILFVDPARYGLWLLTVSAE